MDEAKETYEIANEIDYQQLLFRQIDRIEKMLCMLDNKKSSVRALENALSGLESLLYPYHDKNYKSAMDKLRNESTHLSLYHKADRSQIFDLLKSQFSELIDLCNRCGLLTQISVTREE